MAIPPKEPAEPAASPQQGGADLPQFQGFSHFRTEEMTVEELGEPCAVEYAEQRHGASSPVAIGDDIDTMLQDKFNHALEVAVSSTSATTAFIAKLVSPEKLTLVAATDEAILGQSLHNSVDDDGNSLVAPFGLFQPVEEEEAAEEQAEGEEGGEPAKVNKPLYIKNVLRDASVDFLKRVPQLGAFCAVKIPFKDSMHKDAVPEDGGLIVPAPSAEESGEDAEEEEIAEKQPAEEEEAKDDGENAEGAEGVEEKEEAQQPEQRWRANLRDGFYVLCVDTMDNGEELSEEEIRTLESLAAALSKCLTPTLDLQYQGEMALRALASSVVEAAVIDLEAAKEKISEETQAALEGTEDAEEEEKAAKEAETRLERFGANVLDQEWWPKLLQFTRKRCIPLQEPVEEAIKYAYELIFAATYPGLKEVDPEVFVKAVKDMPQTEQKLVQQTAQQHVDKISEILENSMDGIRQEALWLDPVLHCCKYTLQHQMAAKSLRDLLEAKAASAAEAEDAQEGEEENGEGEEE